MSVVRSAPSRCGVGGLRRTEAGSVGASLAGPEGISGPSVAGERGSTSSFSSRHIALEEGDMRVTRVTGGGERSEAP